jgi:vacuole morphology and inheritance protein 14
VHFRSVQAKHEKARRQAAGVDMSAPFADYPTLEERESAASPPPGRRRKVDAPPPLAMPGRGSGALSPLNPRSRTSGLLASALGGGRARPTSPNNPEVNKGKRAPSLGRKP